jgi:hypothetical protein
MELPVQDAIRRRISWPSVFAGSFVFLAIEVTFGLLALAIFRPTHGTNLMGSGPGIWMIVLSIIALYFGARAATYLSGEIRKLDGLYCGLVTFGLSIFASLLVGAMVVGNAVNTGVTLDSMVTANAAWLFITLILGGFAACIGGAIAASEGHKPAVMQQPAAMRPAA